MWSSSGPHFGVHIWTQKWGQPSENFAAARTCCASRFATLQLEHECQLIPFSLCASQVRLLLSRSLYRSHVLTTFFGPCFRGHDEAGLLAFEALQVQKVPQPSKPTWVSVQDVVLNSLRPSTQPSQLLPELSHFYQTHKHKERCLAHVAMVLVGVSRLDTKWCGVASWHLSVNFTKAIKNTCPHKKSLHQDMVCLFK